MEGWVRKGRLGWLMLLPLFTGRVGLSGMVERVAGGLISMRERRWVLTENRFTGQVKLHSILLRTSDSDSAPRTMKVIINRDDVDFGVAEETSGTQEFELSRTGEVQELPVVCLSPVLISPSLWWLTDPAPGAVQRGPPAGALLPGQLWRRGRGRHAHLVCRVPGRVDAARAGADEYPLRGGGQPQRSQAQGDERESDGQRDWRGAERDVAWPRGHEGWRLASTLMA